MPSVPIFIGAGFCPSKFAASKSWTMGNESQLVYPKITFTCSWMTVLVAQQKTFPPKLLLPALKI
jgi:hypothetical protein